MEYVKTYESLFDAYHSLILREEKRRGEAIELPPCFLSRSNLQLWSQLPVLTASLPVLPVAQLQATLPRISSFGRTFHVMTTGITAPKTIQCFSTQNRCFTQLAKHDEVRSDCVVQQLFELLNSLLIDERSDPERASLPEAVIDALWLRTYKVGDSIYW